MLCSLQVLTQVSQQDLHAIRSQSVSWDGFLTFKSANPWPGTLLWCGILHGITGSARQMQHCSSSQLSGGGIALSTYCKKRIFHLFAIMSVEAGTQLHFPNEATHLPQFSNFKVIFAHTNMGILVYILTIHNARLTVCISDHSLVIAHIEYVQHKIAFAHDAYILP